jgi:arginyl-tRNA synthetase
VQKSDGGYLYATTDLAALEHRVAVERADRVVYVTDAGQAQHFAMVFAAARKAGLLQRPDSAGPVRLQHVTFGLVLGEDGKKIRSRAGDSVRLRDLLDEAVRLAEEGELQRRGAVASALEGTATGGDELSEDSLQVLRDRARVVGLGAVKYADLSMHRESNYRFPQIHPEQ